MSKSTVELAQMLFDAISAGHLLVYRNVLNHVHACYKPPDTGEDFDMPAIEGALESKEFRDWLTLFAFRAKNIVLRQPRVQGLVRLLGGYSLSRPSALAADRALLDLLECEPVIAVVVEFMQAKYPHGGRFESAMEPAWMRLNEFAKERRLLRRGRKRFPAGANVLSRELRLLSDALMRLGIRAEIYRSNGSKLVLERLDGSSGEPSAEPSAVKSQPGNALAHSDERNEILAALEQKRRV